MLYEYNEMELRALASGYHHGASGDLPFNIYAVGSKAFEAYEWGYENGVENCEDQNEYVTQLHTKTRELIDNANRSLDAEDFPEHEGLDNQDFPIEDDDTPFLAIQIVDGEVYGAYATTPVRLYVMTEGTDPGYVPEGLRIDERGALNYASKWARGNVQFEN